MTMPTTASAVSRTARHHRSRPIDMTSVEYSHRAASGAEANGLRWHRRVRGPGADTRARGPAVA